MNLESNISKTLIIAEAGVNHNGDLKIAKELIHQAAIAGADLVKFQTFTVAKLLTLEAPKAASVIDCEYDKNKILQAVKKLYNNNFQTKLALVKNPYGAAGASLKIHNKISTISLHSVLQKKFYDFKKHSNR